MAYTLKTTPLATGIQADISALVQWPSIGIDLWLTQQVSSMQFDIKVRPGRTLPGIGDTVDFYDGAAHIFGGVITQKSLKVDGGVSYRYQFTCTSWSFAFDKKLVVKTYTNMEASLIVKDIISIFTNGFTATNVATTTIIVPSLSFNYQAPSQCLKKICQLIGYDFYIDSAKDVHFFNTDNVAAPFNLTDTSGNYQPGTLAIDTSLQNIKNSVFVIGGNYQKTFTSGNTADIYKTDGTALVFPLAFSYDPATIAVTLAGVAQTVGIDQKDTFASFQVLYNAGQNGVGAFIRFNAAPTTGQVLNISGNASIPILGHYSDSTSVIAYGEYQDNVVDKLIASVAEAQNRAKAEVLQYGNPTISLKFSTLSSGLLPGQTITLSSSVFGISAQNFTVQNVQITGNTPATLIYTVTAVSAVTISFNQIMTLLLEAELMQNAVPASTVLEVLIGINEALAIADAVTVTTSTGPYKWGSFTWGFGVWQP